MADPMAFEGRLSIALDGYADRAAVEADIPAIVRAAIAGTRRDQAANQPFAWARRSVWLRLGVAVALLLLAAVVIALIGRERTPTLGGGRILVGFGTTGLVFEPTLAEPRRIQLAPNCVATLADGGGQVVTHVSHGPWRIKPIDADPSAPSLSLTGAAIPGYGGTNSEWWSPDGSGFALARYAKQSDDDPPGGIGALMVLSIRGRGGPSQTTFEIPGFSVFEWSADSRHIAAVGLLGDNLELLDIDLTRGIKRSVATYRPSTRPYATVSWTAGGSKLAIWVGTDQGDRPALVDAVSGEILTVTLPSGLGASLDQYLLWSPDGTRLMVSGSTAMSVVVATDGRKLFDLPTGTPIDTFKGPTTWSPDSRQLALLDGEILRVVSADGRRVGDLPIGGGEGPTSRLAWSPDGSSMAVVTTTDDGYELAIYDASTLERTASAIIPTGAPVPMLCFQWVRPVD